MPRLLLKFSLLITLILTITCLAARVLGSTQPPNPALRGFTEGCEDKPQPCLYGIVPGVTKIQDAQKQVERLGYDLYAAEDEWSHYSNLAGSRTNAQPCSNIHLRIDDKITISQIFLVGCKNVSIGELSFLGFPKRILQGPDLLIQLGEYATIQISQYGVLDGQFYFKEWSPYSIVNNIDIGSSMSGAHKVFELVGFDWRGFLPHWRYCQLEPTSKDCTK